MVNFTMLAHNRARLTKQALDSIEGTKDMNVAILAHKCDEETTEVVTQWSKRTDIPNIVEFSQEAKGTGALRNDVIRLAQANFGRGAYLYLSDNDIFVKSPRWLEDLVMCYEKVVSQKFRVLGGIDHPAFYGKYEFAVVGAYNHPYHQPIGSVQVDAMMKVNEVLAIALQSMLMTWSVWDKFGPFRETPVGAVCQGEDVDFGSFIRNSGYRLGVVVPPLIVNTGITNSFGERIPGWEIVARQAPAGVVIE